MDLWSQRVIPYLYVSLKTGVVIFRVYVLAFIISVCSLRDLGKGQPTANIGT